MKKIINNNSAGVILLITNMICILSYCWMGEIMELVQSGFLKLDIINETNAYAMLVILMYIAFFSWYVARLKSYAAHAITIKFPYKLHCILLLIELAYVIMMSLGGVSVEDIRAGIASGEYATPRLYKITTLMLYMTTMMLFAKCALIMSSKVKNLGSKWPLIAVVFFTFMNFIYKDVAIGSRGSTINLIAFSIAGWSYVRPITFNAILRSWRAVIIYGLLLFLLLFGLSIIRSGEAELYILWDSLFFRLASNIMVTHNYLVGLLNYRTGISGEYISGWIRLDIFGYNGHGFSLFHFFPSIGEIVEKYIFFNDNYQKVSVYFDVYGDYPYNAYHFTLPLLMSGGFGTIFVLMFLSFLKLISNYAVHINFYVYCFFVYFAITSFTGLSIVEIPFLLIPFMSIFFRDSIRSA
jgi:hypothetical protein